MTNEDFIKLQISLEHKLTFTQDNLSTKLMEYAFIHQTLLKILTDLQTEQNELEQKRIEMYGNLYRLYKFESEYRWEARNEVESQIFSDKKYLAIIKELNDISVQVTYVGKTVDGMKNISYTARAYIDYQKLLSGA
jgi:Na+/phosphate symporter